MWQIRASDTTAHMEPVDIQRHRYRKHLYISAAHAKAGVVQQEGDTRGCNLDDDYHDAGKALKHLGSALVGWASLNLKSKNSRSL